MTRKLKAVQIVNGVAVQVEPVAGPASGVTLWHHRLNIRYPKFSASIPPSCQQMYLLLLLSPSFMGNCVHDRTKTQAEALMSFFDALICFLQRTQQGSIMGSGFLLHASLLGKTLSTSDKRE